VIAGPRPPSIFVVTVSWAPSAVIAKVSVTFTPLSDFDTISMWPSVQDAVTAVVPPRERSSSTVRPSV
jgi:hypothetical protein